MIPEHDLIAAFVQVFGPQPVRDYPYDGGIEGPTPDLFVSDSEARYRQREVDDVLSERWSA